MKNIIITTLTLCMLSFPTLAQNQNDYQEQFTVNPYTPNAINPNSIETNPYGTSSNSPKLYDSQGNFRGNVNSNQYDPDSISNPYGKYGNKYSPDSINNQYGAGNPYNNESPYNQYGSGLELYSE